MSNKLPLFERYDDRIELINRWIDHKQIDAELSSVYGSEYTLPQAAEWLSTWFNEDASDVILKKLGFDTRHKNRSSYRDINKIKSQADLYGITILIKDDGGLVELTWVIPYEGPLGSLRTVVNGIVSMTARDRPMGEFMRDNMRSYDKIIAGDEEFLASEYMQYSIYW
jgi:hypothetical protein